MGARKGKGYYCGIILKTLSGILDELSGREWWKGRLGIEERCDGLERAEFVVFGLE